VGFFGGVFRKREKGWEVKALGGQIEFEFHITAAGNFNCIGERRRLIGEEPIHFCAAFHIKLVAGIAHPVGVG